MGNSLNVENRGSGAVWSSAESYYLLVNFGYREEKSIFYSLYAENCSGSPRETYRILVPFRGDYLI